MPADVAEDTLELMIDLLEAGPPTTTSYPYPSLQKTGRLDRRTFRTLILENAFLRATVVPELGGRILRLEDLRASADIWTFQPHLELGQSGLRGVVCPAGLQILTGFDQRLNSMGVVASMPDFTGEEESPSGVWLGEICGDGLSLNFRFSISDDEPCFDVEVRAFNRTLEPIPYNGGISIGGEGDWISTGDQWVWHGPRGSIAVEGPFSYAESGSLHRFDRLRQLAPRQLDSWTMRLFPFGIGSNLRAVNRHCAVGWDRDELAIQATLPILGAKVVIRTVSEKTLELPVELGPSMMSSFDLASLADEITDLVLLDVAKVELIRASQLPRQGQAFRAEDEVASPGCNLESSELELQSATFDVHQRHLAHLLLGYRHLARREFIDASRELEQSLLYNAEDHLAWWAKAVAERMGETGGDEQAELLNAHFLAPLEPALRVESFLASPSQAKEKSAVLNPLEETPEVFVEAACLLIEANLLDQAATWLDEAIRHIDLPMLRYLFAYVMLIGSKLDVQAAEQIQLAVRQKPEPPFPWRQVERAAIQALIERLPSDSSLRRIGELIPKSSRSDEG